jgi:phytoene synthase
MPMAQLARHGLSRAQLRSQGAARQQAVKAQLDDLLASWTESATLAGPLSVFRALESRHAHRLAQRAARAGDALAVLQAGHSRTGLATALQAWQAARAWRRQMA